MEPLDSVGVGCGHCGGPVYMEPCPGHEYVIASECQRCGVRYVLVCPECPPTVTWGSNASIR